MKSMIMAYVNGSDEAIELYQKAFNAELGFAMPSMEKDCKYYHAELNIHGQNVAILEAKHVANFYESPTEEGVKFFSQTERIAGNVVSICIYYDKGDTEKIKHAYEVLRENSITIIEPGSVCDSPCMVEFIDKFGIRWYLIESPK